MKNLKPHSILALSIKDVQEYNKLYEGLIYTYSLNDTCGALSKLMNKYHFKYYKIKNEKNTFPYIQINLLDDNSEKIIKEITHLMNTYGWYPIDVIDKFGESFHKRYALNTIHNIKNVEFIIFRAKHEIEIDEKAWPKILYHITPIKNLKNILTNGLKPKSESKLSGHDEYVHLYDISKSDLTILELIKQLDEARQKKDFIKDIENKYAVLKIDMNWLKQFKLFCDPDLNYSYFMKNNIHPNYITVDKIIDI